MKVVCDLQPSDEIQSVQLTINSGEKQVTTQFAINDFLAQKNIAVVGVSRSGKKFGNTILKNLQTKGYRTVVVHPEANMIDGNQAYPNLSSLSGKVDGVIIVVPPAETEKVVQEAAQIGIKRIWIQQGAESDKAIQFCQTHGISVVAGECILMFAEPVSFAHRMHRWVRKIFGKLPQ